MGGYIQSRNFGRTGAAGKRRGGIRKHGCNNEKIKRR